MNVHSSFICNRQKLKTDQVLHAGEWLNNLVHLNSGVLLSNKSELLILATTRMHLQEIMLR